MSFLFFFFNDTATTEIYTLSLHDALPISRCAAHPSHPPLLVRRNLFQDHRRSVASLAPYRAAGVGGVRAALYGARDATLRRWSWNRFLRTRRGGCGGCAAQPGAGGRTEGGDGDC